MIEKMKYKQLVSQHSVLFGNLKYKEDFDVVIQSEKHDGYSLYTIVKNEPKLTNEELIIICDGGYSNVGIVIEDGAVVKIYE